MLTATKTFLIADDHAIVRDGMATRLRKMFADCTIYEAATFDEVLRLVKEHTADLLLLDINMPGGNSIKMLDHIFLRNKHIKVLILSALSEELYGLRYLKAGAHGYLSKTAGTDELENAILCILQDKQYISENMGKIMLSQIRNQKGHKPIGMESLSDREIEVAGMLVKGKGLLEISNALNISTSSVNTYKFRIFKKTEVTNIVELLDKMRMFETNL